MLLFCLLSLWKLRESTAWELLEYFWHKWDICDMHLFCRLSLWKLREFTAWELFEFSDTSETFVICICFVSFSVQAAWVCCLKATWIFLTQVKYFSCAAILPSFCVKAAWLYSVQATWIFLTSAGYLWYAAVLLLFSVRAAWVCCLKATWIFLTSARYFSICFCFAFFLCESCVSFLL